MSINPAIFKEYDIRGEYPHEISDEIAYALGFAFARIIKAKKIVVGRDARLESERAFWPLISGLAKGGAQIADLGVCATPELFFAVGARKFAGGVMVTASHSPQGQTGFKFCDSQGRVFGQKSGQEKLALWANKEFAKIPAGIKFLAQNDSVDFISIAGDYKEFALSFIEPAEVEGMNLVIDASGGSGGRLAEVVFNSLPVKFSPLNFRVAKNRLQHGPNPLLPENQQAAISQVKDKQADLGVIFDGDADRAIFIDESGRFVEPYYINCLLAQIILAENKRATIVADARLYLAIAKVVKSSGGKLLVHRSGYANFIKSMTAKKKLFGCENSGHFMYNFSLKEKRQFVYGDAIISVLLILKYLKQNKLKLSQAVKPFSDSFVISGELNFQTDRFEQIAQDVKKIFSEAKFISIDGLSALSKHHFWFFNLRPSHTEPVIRLNIEARNGKLLKELQDKLLKCIKKNS